MVCAPRRIYQKFLILPIICYFLSYSNEGIGGRHITLQNVTELQKKEEIKWEKEINILKDLDGLKYRNLKKEFKS